MLCAMIDSFSIKRDEECIQGIGSCEDESIHRVKGGSDWGWFAATMSDAPGTVTAVRNVVCRRSSHQLAAERNTSLSGACALRRRRRGVN